MLYIRWRGGGLTRTLVYKNINSLFIYYEMSKSLCERKSVGLLWLTLYLQIYTKWRYISREPCFFVLLSWEADTSISRLFNSRATTPMTMWLVYLAGCSPQLNLGLKTYVIYFSDAHTKFLLAQFMLHFHCPFTKSTLTCCQRSLCNNKKYVNIN